MKKELKNLGELLLVDPETGHPVDIVSDIEILKNGSFTFVIENRINGTRWRHTIKTEQILNRNPIKNDK